MREILFRAKTIANDSKWVEGFYVHIPCGRFMSDEHDIQTIDEDGRIGMLFNVYESTLGQFTGLTDKNGKKIFEGDILAIKFFPEYVERISWEGEPDAIASVFWDLNAFSLDAKGKLDKRYAGSA